MAKQNNKSPYVKEGRSLDKYLKRHAKEYATGKLDSTKDVSKLKKGKHYCKIGDTYYQTSCRPFFKTVACVIGGLAVVTSVVVPVTLTMIYNRPESYQEYNFQYWNDAPALKVLKDYVKEVVTPTNKTYIPKIDRIATFDMDGTLFGERAPIYIEWLMFNDYYKNKQTRFTDTDTFTYTYYDKTQKKDVDKEATYGELYKNIVDFGTGREIPASCKETLEMMEAFGGANVFSDITLKEYENYVTSFLNNDVDAFTNLKFKDMFYKPMEEVIKFLQLNNFDVYIVSGTDRFMIREIVNNSDHKHYNIPNNKFIGMDVKLDINDKGEVIRTNKLMYKNVEKVKVELIAQEIGKKPVLSFGNSGGDVEMHDYCLSNTNYITQVFMVNNDDNEREYSQDRSETWKKHPKYNVFSMKDDWKTIYGDNVKKTGK